jgi:hypothetical protein
VPERQEIDEQQPEPAAAMPDEAVVVPPAVTPAVALPTGAHASELPGGMHELLGASSETQRGRFVLQLQRTAGNAAVTRWLLDARARFLERHAATGGEPPPEENEPRPR